MQLMTTWQRAKNKRHEVGKKLSLWNTQIKRINVFLSNVIDPHLAHDSHLIPPTINTTSPLPHGGDVNIENNQKFSPGRV